MPGTFSPAADFKWNRWLAIPACIPARAWRTCRDTCRDRSPAVTGKTFPAFPAHAHPQFCVSGKRPMASDAMHDVPSFHHSWTPDVISVVQCWDTKKDVRNLSLKSFSFKCCFLTIIALILSLSSAMKREVWSEGVREWIKHFVIWSFITGNKFQGDSRFAPSQ